MTSDTNAQVLSVQGYSLDYRTAKGPFHALKDINLSIGAGEIVGLVGESGSGKSSLAWSIMRFLPGNAHEVSGAIHFDGSDLMARSNSEIEAIRGKRISMVFQDPATSLNPTLSLGRQISEVLVRHQGLSKKQAWAEAEARLAHVGLKTPAQMMHRFPHEASGGEKQRVVIATAFACNPELIIFDEPTTALDVITSRQILDLFQTLQQETGVASLYISHDLALVATTAQRVSVINKGEIVEQGQVDEIFSRPQDAYTKKLIAAVPDPSVRLAGKEPDYESDPLAEVENVSVTYGRKPFFGRFSRKAGHHVTGNRAVNLSIQPGEILGIVGESGSGKSTLAKAMTGLNKFEGEIRFEGRAIHTIADMNDAYRRDVQIIFQHPDASLNPRKTIGDILSRPYRLYTEYSGKAMRNEIARLLEQVKLPAAYAARYPHQLSGGEKQRVAIARAFASQPKLVICDEITSALDVSVQASVIELLMELREEFGTAYLFITHDINLVRQIAHRIAVMYRGDLIDIAPTRDIAAPQRADYTRQLLDAVPVPVARSARDASNLSPKGEIRS